MYDVVGLLLLNENISLFLWSHASKLIFYVVCVCSDYIESPCSQEDDIHNVQSVIDSLSLDYLQISLSHITGKINTDLLLFTCVHFTGID